MAGDVEIRKVGVLLVGNVRQSLAFALRGGFWRLAEFARRKTVERTPVGATGKARQSIMAEVRSDGMGGRVYSNLIYMPPLEFGTRPHFPPPAALAYWAQRKLRVSAADAPGVGFAIARKIAARGTPAREMFKRALTDTEAEARHMVPDLADSIRKEFERE